LHTTKPNPKHFQTGTKGNLLHSNQAKRQRFKSCFAWNYKATTKQKHKGNLLHTKQAKRQRFKKLFRLELAKPHTKQTHKGNLLHLQTRQNGKGLKIVSLGTANTPPSKGTKEIYCTPNRQSGKNKEAVTLFCF